MRGARSSWSRTSTARRSMPMRLWASRASETKVRHMAREVIAGMARIPRIIAAEAGSVAATAPIATPAIA